MPLRPDLCERLCRRFARAGGVLIADEGCAMQYAVEKDALTGLPRLQIAYSGEYFRTCCPYCNDTRHRLWINHRWGYLDPETRSRNLWLCHCFNEDCLRTNPRQLDLYRRVFEDCGPRRPDVLAPGVAAPPPVKPEMPGQTYPLHRLPADHHANAYLRRRGYDPETLGRILGVGYCPEPSPRFQCAGDRIVVPVLFNGKLAGWQARLVGEPTDRATPKYITMAGMKKSRLLYNYDLAVQHPFAVVCEGVSDVWRVGPPAVALFGKDLSAAQRQLIAAAWGGGAAVVLLDGDAADEGRKVYDALAGVVQRRVLVRLPVNADPGGLPTEEIWIRIGAAAREQGVVLPQPQLVGR